MIVHFLLTKQFITVLTTTVDSMAVNVCEADF